MNYVQMFKLGEVKVIPSEYLVEFPDGEQIKLQGKFIRVLSHIAANHTKVVTREELIDVIWNGNIYVGEKALTNAIWQIRAIFREKGIDSKVVDTIRGVGYRLVDTPVYLENESALSHVQSGESQNKPWLTARFKTSMFAALLVSITCLCIIIYLYPKPAPVFHTPEIITNDPGTESYAAPSPDGQKLVYRKKYKNANTDLILLDLQSNQQVKLTNDDMREGIVRWSPTENKIYFSRKTRKNKRCEIVSLNLDNNALKTITQCISGSSFTYMDISPDGSTLAYQGPKYEFATPGIYFLDLTEQGSVPVRWSCYQDCVNVDRDIAFSPDGTHVALTKRISSLNEDLYIVNMETNETKQITKGEQDISGIDWHPNGHTLVYGSRRADLRAGYIIDTKSNKKTKLPIEGFRFPSFAAATGELFFETRKEFQGISKVKYDQKDPTFPEPLIESEFSYSSPDYSAVNNKIAYVSNVSGHYELWTMDHNGTNRQQQTHLKKYVSSPKWSTKQQKIVFLVKEKMQAGNFLYTYDVANGEVKRVDSPFESHARPSWNADDTAIYSAISRESYKDIFEISIESGTQKRITFDGGRYGQPYQQDQLLYTRKGNGLWLKSLHDNENGTMVLNKKQFKDRYSWALVNNSVFYRKKRRSHYELREFQLDSNHDQLIAHIPAATSVSAGSIAVNNDKRTIYYPSEHHPQGSIYRLLLE